MYCSNLPARSVHTAGRATTNVKASATSAELQSYASIMGLTSTLQA